MVTEGQFPKTFGYVVYKITFPNGKIYVGKDVSSNGHSVRYFGSWDSSIVEAEFTREQLEDFSLRKQILFESSDKVEVARMEMRMIKELEANNPKKGYNRTPKFRPAELPERDQMREGHEFDGQNKCID
ncbi:MAG: hypothetical protein JJ868_13885 [Shimia sp.]|uniref:hypothetical protein n=1 Tax=Shimia sp. TaxID=1954381 RepID=UPI001B03CADC|nr:hypothetical protein [Shimia sp.]MBO6898459.1 hypothetical protein [Shimia sp.]